MGFLKGLLIGFAVAVPVGPIALICINKTLQKGRLAGLIAGLGAATADLVYALGALFLYRELKPFLEGHRPFLVTLGVLLIVTIAVRLILHNEPDPDTKISPLDYLGVFVLTMVNPITLFAFAAIMATLNVPHSSWVAIGVFLGSTAWWAILVSITGRLGKRLEYATLKKINLWTGGLLLVLAAGIIITSFQFQSFTAIGRFIRAQIAPITPMHDSPVLRRGMIEKWR